MRSSFHLSMPLPLLGSPQQCKRGTRGSAKGILKGAAPSKALPLRCLIRCVNGNQRAVMLYMLAGFQALLGILIESLLGA